MVLLPWMSASRRLNTAIADVLQTYRRMGKLQQLDPETMRELEERHRLTTKFRQRST
jgi:hypothetical protein